MSKRSAWLIALIVLLVPAARADFSALVRAISSHRGLHRVIVPGISLARIAVWMMHPEGVYDFQLAVFEGDAQLDARAFEAIARSNGSARLPVVQVHSNRTGEMTVIWAFPSGGDRVEFLLMTHDPRDNTVVLRALIDAEMFAREMEDPRHATRIAQRFPVR